MTDLLLREAYLSEKRALFDRYYDKLNEKQREAVYQVNGPLLILAGAGSGKTTVLVNRLAHIIRYGDAVLSDLVPTNLTEETIAEMKKAGDLPHDELGEYLVRFAVNPPAPWQVMAITFTNKAAREIKSRIGAIFGEDSPEMSEIRTGTFHAVCVQILRRFCDQIGYDRSFSICDTDDVKKQLQLCMKQLGIDDKMLPVKTVQNAISRAKDKLIGPEEYMEKTGGDVKYRQNAQISALYAEKLKAQNLLDFDDIIMQTVRLLTECEDVRSLLQNRYRYISVDEYQDTNFAQLELTLLLSAKYKNIMVVGDDDQSIYKFRGAVIENILNFDKNYEDTAVVRLEENYRSTKTILAAANGVISHNEGRLGKTLWTGGEEGDPVVIKQLGNQNDEARFIADVVQKGVEAGGKYKDYAVLYRMNSQSRSIEQAFAKAAIPYRILGGMRFFDRMEVKDLVAYLALINNPNDDLRLRRIINTPRRGIGDKSVQIAEALAAEEGCPLLEFLRRAKRYNAISSATANQMVNFVYLMDRFREAAETMTPSSLIEYVAEECGYNRMLSEMTDLSERDDRMNNIGELVSAARAYEETADEPSLVGFLEDVALVSDVDKYDETADAVVLMTIHSAKGLEFPVVFLPGMEENVFPSFQTLLNPEEIEEERRLAYVAITRAKRRVYITHVQDRMLNGRTGSNPLSRYAQEIPPELCDREDEVPENADSRLLRQRPPKQKPVNFFLNETSKPAPGLERKKSENAAVLEPGDTVKHMTFGVGVVLSVRPMGGDTLY
ncbi:MAG: UvrD-helicase domain-containing protein, partial [Clostridia bacterium]|nr:UvrD-helicase domain-containing protein [Clostridia bacterium]